VSAAVTAALALACVLLLVFAVTSPGYPVRHLDLHDGGIWVTNNSAGLFGRLNKPIRQLDDGFAPTGGAQSTYHVDVLQNDNWVVAVDASQRKLYPVDEARGALQATSFVPLPTGFLPVTVTESQRAHRQRGPGDPDRLHRPSPCPQVARSRSTARTGVSRTSTTSAQWCGEVEVDRADELRHRARVMVTGIGPCRGFVGDVTTMPNELKPLRGTTA
jgi:hypothetical protein